MRKFIREALNSERVIDVRHGTQPADAHVGLRRAILDTKICKIIRNVRPALLQMAGIAVNRIHIEYGWNRREDRALQPRGWLAVRTQSRLQIHGSNGVVVVE